MVDTIRTYRHRRVLRVQLDTGNSCKNKQCLWIMISERSGKLSPHTSPKHSWELSSYNSSVRLVPLGSNLASLETSLNANISKNNALQSHLCFGKKKKILDIMIQGAAAAAKSLRSCLTLWPHRRQPTRLPRPWDSPGKNTRVGCHFLLQCMKVKSLSHFQLLATPWTVYQAPPSMEFSRQEYWSGLPLPSLDIRGEGLKRGTFKCMKDFLYQNFAKTLTCKRLP